MLKSKIHRATVTACDLKYVGSLTIDEQLMEAADIFPYEQIAVVNVNNGARFETYAMVGSPGSGEMQVNGAAARLAEVGDTIIVFSYAEYEPAQAEQLQPLVVLVDDANRMLTGAGR
jgi:aspartate 1-decarboxylase